MNIFLISALCEEGQININSALKEELDNLYGIGPVKAEEIINSRPFQSVNELIKVIGIGNITLNKIKEQGLACINGEIEEINKEPNEAEEENTENIDLPNNQDNPTEETKDIQQTPIQLSIIKLNSKDIKTEDNKEELTKSKCAKYGFVVFCVLLGFLFILRKNKNKNEFEE
jgi:competence ComEA-like helix-hairpin-helix protein